jgi:hypothetical protein
MRFPGRLKIPLHAYVQLLRSAFEPATTARSQYRRLLDFFQAQQRAIEISCRGFTTFGRGNLNVVDARNSGIHAKKNSTVRFCGIASPLPRVFKMKARKHTYARQAAAPW